MPAIDVAVIGTGPDPAASRAEKGYSMGYRHANAYDAIDDCSIVGCSDLVGANADAFAANFDLPDSAAFEDHLTMLDAVEPDLVSICTPPKSHPSLVAECAAHHAVGGIHCEKPMAPTWGACKQLAADCEDESVQLTINLQNRGRPAVATVTELLSAGEIGELERVEIARADLMQTGIHNLDLANHFAGDADIAWVLGQADVHEEQVWYTDMHVESQGLGLWAYENGVHGLAFTGDDAEELLGTHLRLLGSRGVIELEFWSDEPVRVRSADSDGWRPCAVGEGDAQTETLRDIVDSLRTGEPSIVSADKALRVTELVFAIWESASRRGRVDLPLTNERNALEDVINE